LPRAAAGRKVSAMTTRGAFAIALFGCGFGVYVLVGEGLPALHEGRAVLGWVITACAAIGTALSLAGLIGLLSRLARPPSRGR
jgi:hypothetical protein